MELGDIIIRDPTIMVIKNSLGLVNVATLGKKVPLQAKEPHEPLAPAGGGQLQVLSFLAVDRLSVTNGQLTYRDGASPSPLPSIRWKSSRSSCRVSA